MIPDLLQPLANHLWQSTLFVVVPLALTLALKRNRARIRYLLWLSASVKFLIPFSLLVAVGGHLGRHATPAISRPRFPSAVKLLTQPFVPAFSAAVAEPIPPATNALPYLLGVVWTIGFTIVAFTWWKRWRQARAALRTASPLRTLGEIQVLSSPSLIEPGVFGLLRPVLLLPESTADWLTEPQLKAILAHELSHIRRHDNVAAAVHMAVETLFWFHPLVWWLGARLVEERERACDEDVLSHGHEPDIYAESILRICELYLKSPLQCLAGVTGGNLRRRIERIMSESLVENLDTTRKLLLAGVAALALAMPLIVGVMNAPVVDAQLKAQPTTSPLQFDVASIKPNNSADLPKSNFSLGPGDVYIRNGGVFQATGFPLMTYIAFAYRVIGNEAQYLLPQLPAWAKTERFDIEARAEGDPGKDQMRLMMRSLLADRFKLALRYEDREVPVLAFVPARTGQVGPQLQAHADTSPPCPTEPDSASTPNIVNGAPAFCNGIYPLPPSTPGRLRFGGRNVTIAFIANTLEAQTNLGRPMIDQTGLTGKFDFTMEWAPDPPNGPANPDADDAPPDSAAGPSFTAALREQLGIRLQSQKGSVRVPVIDHVEHPSSN